MIFGFVYENPNLDEERWFCKMYNDGPTDFAHNSRTAKALL